MVPAVQVRQVWSSNIEHEFEEMIHESLTKFKLVSMDTEFPGTVIFPSPSLPKHGFSSLSTDQHYSLMKQNVNALKIIQIGLTLSDSSGNVSPTWQFNFSDFNVDDSKDHRNPTSIALLKRHGINFAVNNRDGIDSRDFARLFKEKGLSSGRAWVTFHGLYDFGFLIKILSGKQLPDDRNEFMALMRRFLGEQVYDLKSIGREFGLLGGLEKVAGKLYLERAAGEKHQAGSDSLLTMQAFLRLLKINAPGHNAILMRFRNDLYGLTTPQF